jgi:serine/threonine-protein kinase
MGTRRRAVRNAHGKRLFEGETVSDTLVAVLKAEPDWNLVPPQARKLLQRCLERDPKRRLRDIGDAWALLEQPSECLRRRTV